MPEGQPSTSLMGIIERARDVAELVKKYNDQDLYERIVELREAILELREENLRLREEAEALREASATQAEIERAGNCYFRKTDKEREFPFCLACWDHDRKLIGLMVEDSPHGRTIKCGICATRKPSG